ncbi:DUF1801 domain-containing protein [Sphingomonas jeddahensis]|uniref:DUF1801 domain-containing protein n=1 Tax=Sphingomonas jeddahensis TaxID=1915074 RepID=UPI001E641936|nr:DUF1801 domain-containing protein [Sphingomonas jeddahensis]
MLAGGNPQIPKGEGNEPVQAYLDAMPGWKQQIGLLIDRLVLETVPGVAKAVKWNTPLYGLPGQGWFLAFHCFEKYVKVTFFQGMSLAPIPPGKSKQPHVRYLDIRETDEVDEPQLVHWIAQASALPGERQ